MQVSVIVNTQALTSTNPWLCCLLRLQSLQTLQADRATAYQTNALLSH